MAELQQDQLDRIETKVDRIETHITGGPDPSRGFIVRLALLEAGNKREDAASRRSRNHLYAVLIGAITSIAAAIASIAAAHH